MNSDIFFYFYLLQKRLYKLSVTSQIHRPPAKPHLPCPVSSNYPPLMWPECLTVPTPAPHWLSESGTWCSLGKRWELSPTSPCWMMWALPQHHHHLHHHYLLLPPFSCSLTGQSSLGRAAWARSASTRALAALQARRCSPVPFKMRSFKGRGFAWPHFKVH